MAATWDTVIEEIKIQHEARIHGFSKRPQWPMIILRSPKAGQVRKKWTARKQRITGDRTKCRLRRWQASQNMSSPEEWMKSYSQPWKSSMRMAAD